MKRIYTSKVAPLLLIVLGGAMTGMIIAIFLPTTPYKDRLILGGLGLFFFLSLLVVIRGTRYELRENELYMRLLVFRMRIPLENIRKVERGNHLWYAGSKFAAAWKDTLLLTYNTYDQVLISPLNPDEFLEALSMLKPGLEVVNK